ncbi:hypothetical protein AC249_AIPGENE12646 [Exaiptasia diaphana]|nr:hypothetical protein AC249_AIPGENE12646 [Exaiptasia diaphana]
MTGGGHYSASRTPQYRGKENSTPDALSFDSDNDEASDYQCHSTHDMPSGDDAYELSVSTGILPWFGNIQRESDLENPCPLEAEESSTDHHQQEAIFSPCFKLLNLIFNALWDQFQEKTKEIRHVLSQTCPTMHCVYGT